MRHFTQNDWEFLLFVNLNITTLDVDFIFKKKSIQLTTRKCLLSNNFNVCLVNDLTQEVIARSQ